MAKKFVINNNELIIGDVKFHKELIKDKNIIKVIGGGYWDYDEDTNTMYFYGDSQEFGYVTKEEFNDSQKSGLDGMILIFKNNKWKQK